MAPILAVHDAGYLGHLQTAYAQNAIATGAPGPVMAARGAVDPARASQPLTDFAARRDHYTYDYEDPILAGTWQAAYWSAQVALTAADRVRRGERAVYALCRPPGHHAMRDQYGGFCYLNNAAVAARWLAACGSVAILDVDYHHGNGTQSIFYADPAVLYLSLHADPSFDYPYYWGYAHERGAGAGLGTNVNLPLPLGTGDERYLTALGEALTSITEFGPSCLIVSMGLDAMGGDAIGKFALTLGGWSEVARRVAALKLPTVIVQEGGYRLDQLGAGAVAFLSPFAENAERVAI